MAKVYEFLANGFEEVEGLAPVDILRRGGVDIKTVSVTGSEYVETCLRPAACTRARWSARVHGFSRFALFFSRIDRGKGFFLARFRLNARLSSNIEANQSATPRKTGKSVQAHRLGPRTCRCALAAWVRLHFAAAVPSCALYAR